MNKFLLLLALAVVVAIVAWAYNTKGHHDDLFVTVGNDEFEKIIADTTQVVVLDVRTQEEFDEGHLANALLIDVKKDDFLGQARQLLPKEKTIALYCRSGRRSVTAAEKLAPEGYKVVNLKWGITGWKAAGKPIVK